MQGVGGNIEHVYNNGRSNQVIFRIPTATDAGKLGLGKAGALTSASALDVSSFFVNDTWNAGRTTVNLGVRYDRYNSFLPAQEQLAATVGPIAATPSCSPRRRCSCGTASRRAWGSCSTWGGDGKTVLKANYGFFWHNPGVGVGSSANPNTPAKNETYGWNDINGDRHWQPGEQTNLISASLQGGVQLDPNIPEPYLHEASVWLERQLADALGMRAGFVYKTEDDLIDTSAQPLRGLDAFTVPFTFVDIGLDGRRGTADDKNITMLGLPSSLASQYPTTTIVSNTGHTRGRRPPRRRSTSATPGDGRRRSAAAIRGSTIFRTVRNATRTRRARTTGRRGT